MAPYLRTELVVFEVVIERMM